MVVSPSPPLSRKCNEAGDTTTKEGGLHPNKRMGEEANRGGKRRGTGGARGLAVACEATSSSDGDSRGHGNPLQAAYTMQGWLVECTRRIARHNGPTFPNYKHSHDKDKC